jgi:hypothetical protein
MVMRVASAIWFTWILLVLSFIAVGPMLGLKPAETSPVMGLSTALILALAGTLGRDGKLRASQFSSFVTYLSAYAQKDTFGHDSESDRIGKNTHHEN